MKFQHHFIFTLFWLLTPTLRRSFTTSRQLSNTKIQEAMSSSPAITYEDALQNEEALVQNLQKFFTELKSRKENMISQLALARRIATTLDISKNAIEILEAMSDRSDTGEDQVRLEMPEATPANSSNHSQCYRNGSCDLIWSKSTLAPTKSTQFLLPLTRRRQIVPLFLMEKGKII